MKKQRFNFEFGDTVWFAYIEPIHTINKHGIRVMSPNGKEIRFSLPKSGKYIGDFENGKKRKSMIIEGAETHTKKITADTFRTALKLLGETLDKKDKKNGNSMLTKRFIRMFPESPYYTTNPEWFV
ncbi:MAG: hypothetical protein DRH57_08580 [Candidatus Cloacimonadota bacterium]|nr:MAG: hypothetical protein DRH57_08580 [Candidatus Cloacimonadota bacterium]